MSGILIAMSLVGGLGAVFGLGLACASRIFHVEVDPRIAAVIDVLPGANCGACGYAGCAGFAEAVVSGKAAPEACAPGGEKVCMFIAEILGVEASAGEARVAVLHCNGTGENCPNEADYVGVASCQAAQLVGSGTKRCPYGCLGLADCVKACPFGALEMGEDGLPHVIVEKCTACGKCVDACPRGLFDIQPVSQKVVVRCFNQQKGAITAKTCKVGCIACKKCEKTCPFDAIHVKGFMAVIDPEKCTNCGLCAEVCPKKTIEDGVEARKIAYVQDTCDGCGACEEACPVKAIEGKEKERRTVAPKCVGCEACVDACPTDSIVMRDR